MTFNYDSREDLSNGYKLTDIKVYDLNNHLIRKIKFNYTYFLSSDTNKNGFMYSNAFPMSQITDEELQKRLKLDSVFIFGKDINADNPLSYSFNYDEMYEFPNRYSFAQDTWGYYNGADDNSGALPSVRYALPGDETSLLFATGNDRRINTDYAKTGSLISITYPEGGRTEFEYESNELLLDYADLIGLEPLFDLPMENQSVMVENNMSYIDRRRLNPETGLYVYSYINDFKLTSDIVNKGTVDYEVVNGITGNQESPVFNVFFEILRKTSITSYEQVFTDALTVNGSLHLVPGDYKIKLTIEASYYNEDTDYAQIVLKWKNKLPEKVAIKTGGLRVKSMKHYSSDKVTPDLMKTYAYPLHFISAFMNIPAFVEDVRIMTGQGNNQCSYIVGRRLSSYSLYPLLSTHGSNGGYTEVIEKVVSTTDERTLYENKYYYSLNNSYNERRNFNNVIPSSYEWLSGNMVRVKNGAVIENQYIYSPVLNPLPEYFPDKQSHGVVMSAYTDLNTAVVVPANVHCTGSIILPKYTYKTGFNMITKKISNRIEDGSDFKMVENYTYGTNSLEPVQTEIIYNEEDIRTIHNYYSGTEQVISELTDPLKSEMALRHMKKLIKTIEKKGNEILNTKLIQYKDWGNNIILPEIMKMSLSSTSLEDRIVYHKYDDAGNALEVSKRDDVHITYIWGYNKALPIAQITNATYDEVAAYVTAVQNKSNMDNDHCVSGTTNCNEEELRIALNLLRQEQALNDALITTYTYDPLIGVTSITDPNGVVTYYEYDDFGRLEIIRDNDGNLVEINEYSYAINRN